MGLVEFPLRRFVVFEALERDGEIEMGVREFGPESNRFAVTVRCGTVLIFAEEHVCEIESRVGIVGFLRNYSFEGGLRAVEIARLHQCNAQRDGCLGEIRLCIEGSAELRKGAAGFFL